MLSFFEKTRGGLIVSSQAGGTEPLNTPEILSALAESALHGGACGIRMAQVENLRFFREAHPLTPLIGLTKPEPIPADAINLVYITPTYETAASIAPFCDVVAMDATSRHRPYDEQLSDIVQKMKTQFPNTLLMADIATLADALTAEKLGFDMIGTTLSGYTAETKATSPSGPDFELLSALIKQVRIPVILEGRVWTPGEVAQAMQLGAHAVVVGSAVTRPHEITKRFVGALKA